MRVLNTVARAVDGGSRVASEYSWIKQAMQVVFSVAHFSGDQSAGNSTEPDDEPHVLRVLVVGWI